MDLMPSSKHNRIQSRKIANYCLHGNEWNKDTCGKLTLPCIPELTPHHPSQYVNVLYLRLLPFITTK